MLNAHPVTHKFNKSCISRYKPVTLHSVISQGTFLPKIFMNFMWCMNR